MTHRLIPLLTVVLLATLGAAAQDATLYFSTEQMPDMLKVLPPPPEANTADFVHDVTRYLWGKTQRLDPERADMARRDAPWNLDSLFAEFSVPFGLEISREHTPAIYTLLVNSLSTIDQVRVEPKAFYHRLRPFERLNEHMLTAYEESSLRGEGSYPSGHTLRGWSIALVLSEVNPDAAEALFRRAMLYGESRVIVGAHWQSDVDASRTISSIAYARLQTSPLYREQVARAQQEFRDCMR